ncbi:hypothetical protein F441_12949 [Phytophthora nicotianae CJ01A1]|uniref:Uncharacterized protein n=6 Tax=Phytophthora nicotianae TaxID=4792 RepID=V9ESH9_PHYNI|nr:hypothetical protein F443_12986 [Phytophthora nicotianae P1569]ETK81830.1 hypothetical protein L915_12688 [Phytophthora nicotianae]ETO70424.1 hypothetical protein F444_13090 [Phytophthora nicotianae P1976]ETP11536.1 hypothetical protein F441_12949 [Phytophthora nicotianae CJ01A1]ETL35240.1 hypothetical protein L916_12596 [Phytophthora nicotianae]
MMLALEVGGYSSLKKASRHTKEARRLASLEVEQGSSHSAIDHKPAQPLHTNSSEMFANHFATIAPHAAVMVVSPKDKSSSPTTPASKDRKKHRAKSESNVTTDKKPVRIASRQSC